MSHEQNLISESETPLTRTSIAADLRQMGVAPGELLLVHSSMNKLGWICGGAQTVVEALLDILGPHGTLVMPGFSSQLSDPAQWSSPPIPKAWVQQVRDNMPLFDPDKTPTRGMGQIVEAFRKWPGTRRSSHPGDSFLARGPQAGDILHDHPLENSLGPHSPLGKMNALGARVLLLGAGYGSCTSFHLAEAGLPGIAPVAEEYPDHIADEKTVWRTVQQPQMFEETFPEIGQELDKIPKAVQFGFAGAARHFSMDIAVKTARTWLIQAMGKTST